MTTPSPNDGYILREDASLKDRLKGMVVRDQSSPPEGRKVKVYFRLPEMEAQRREYPYVTIDLLNIARDPSREHRGVYQFRPLEEYHPPGRGEFERVWTDFPIPTLLTYQVTSFARFVQHDRQIMTQIITKKLPERFGSLVMIGTDEFDSDHSIRRLDVVSGPITADQPDPGDPNKRIFRKAWTVQVSSEHFLDQLHGAAAVAPDKVLIDLHAF